MPPEWEIWLDVNISPIIAKWINEQFNITAYSAYHLNLYKLTDIDIYKKAKERNRVILLSKDIDFVDIILRHGSPPKLILLKTGNCDNRKMWSLLKPNLLQALERLQDDNTTIVELR